MNISGTFAVIVAATVLAGAAFAQPYAYVPNEKSGTISIIDTATDRVTGEALDFCLVVTQRRHVDDTNLVVEGPLAADWIAIAQAFAGPPGAGREPGQLRGSP